MQPIDTSKLSAEVNKSETEISKEMSSKLASASADKQRLAIGLLLKQTLQQLPQSGLLSVDTQKATLSAKNILPGEFTQLYIQDRVEQHKLAEALTRQTVKPAQLTLTTTRQWFAGQMIQSIVYQPTQNGIASLLVNESGQFNFNTPTRTASQSPVTQSPITQSVNTLLASTRIDNAIIKQSQVVTIKTNLPLETGQQLLLQVNKNAAEISFQLKHPPQESHRISQFINQFATKQQALPQLLASLKEISTQRNQTTAYFTPQFKKQAESVLQQLPQLSVLSNEKSVKTALLNSGQFLENKLLNPAITSQTLPGDLKAGLAQLVTLIQKNQAVLLPKQTFPESSLYTSIAQEKISDPQLRMSHFFEQPGKVLHAQVQPPAVDSSLFQLPNHLLLQSRILDQLEGVLSRIIVNQLQTREGGEQQLFNFEVPFRHNDQQEILQLKIREQFRETEAEKGHKIWTVNLAFHLPSLGGIRIYITLDKQDLDIRFWTEEKASQQILQKLFPMLSERLLGAGFTLSQLAAFHGVPESAQKEQQNSQFIIDERV